MISVLTPTIPERARFLEENEASVEAQTFKDCEHLILIDMDREGCSTMMNRLAELADGEWLFILGDDDLILPRCLEIHYEAALESDADIVYAPPLVWGEPPHQFLLKPPNIPAVALIRKETWDVLGGYSTKLKRTEDLDFFTKAKDAGFKFHRADEEPTWIYRFHGDNKSRSHLR